MGLIRTTKKTGREKPCDSQAIFFQGRRDDALEPSPGWRNGQDQWSPPSLASARQGRGSEDKWAHDLWYAQGHSTPPGRVREATRSAPSRLQQRPLSQRGGAPPSASSGVPDDRMRGWSDGASAPVTVITSVAPPQRRASTPLGTVGVRKAIDKASGRIARRAGADAQRRAVLMPAAPKSAASQGLDDAAYSSSGLNGRIGGTWRPQGGKGGKSGKGGKGGKGGGKGGWKGKARGRQW